MANPRPKFGEEGVLVSDTCVVTLMDLQPRMVVHGAQTKSPEYVVPGAGAHA